MMLLSVFNAYSQTRPSKGGVKHDTLSVKERISLHTNAVDWILLTPNIGFEFDLSNMDWGRNTVLFSGKWNGNTSHTFKPSLVYNRMELRGEFRHYFRTEPGGQLRINDSIKVGIKDYANYLFGKKKKNPRIWRAYYWGAYASYGDYSIKLGKEGKQGSYASIGGSFGFGIPLYSYKENSLDFELGASLGFIFTKYDVFTHDAESDCYPRIPEKSKGWHIVPYPMPTNLHVSFVYRFRSIKNKYKAINHERVERQQAQRAARIARRDSINRLEEAEKAIKQAKKDSIQQIKDIRKEEIRNKIAARKDSLNNANLPTDSLKIMEREMKLQAQKEEKLRKEEEKLKKKAEKAEKEKARKEKKNKKKDEKQQEVADPESTKKEEAEL